MLICIVDKIYDQSQSQDIGSHVTQRYAVTECSYSHLRHQLLQPHPHSYPISAEYFNELSSRQAFVVYGM